MDRQSRAMTLPAYFRRQAERCLRLSRSCFDLSTAEQLRTMADDFLLKARELEGRRGMLPPHMIRAPRAGGGDIDCG
jgi:hypothetical protein